MDGNCDLCGVKLTERNTARQRTLGIDGIELCDQCAEPAEDDAERVAWDAARYWVGFPGGMPKEEGHA